MSEDTVSIVLPRQHAQSLYHLVNAASVKGVDAAKAIVEIASAIEAALKDNNGSKL